MSKQDAIEGQDELSTIKARLDQMQISYHPSIGLEKAREKLLAALNDNTQTANGNGNAGAEPAAPAAKTEEQIRQEHIDEAAKLVRVRVTCMNPNKTEWAGELYTVANSVVGTYRKYVPFNVEWHVPNIIFQHMLHRECQIFQSSKDSKGNTTRQSKLIRELAIEVLPLLTPEELHDLAQRQAMAGSIDNA